MRRRCEVCHMPLTYQRRFCSVACRVDAQRVYRTCERCGRPRASDSVRYCSRVCARTAPKTLVCPTCQQPFPFNRLTHARYCSEVCRERSFVWRQALDVLASEPARWWTYAELAQAIYGFAEWQEIKASHNLVLRLRLRGVTFEKRGSGGYVPCRFRLAAREEAAS